MTPVHSLMTPSDSSVFLAAAPAVALETTVLSHGLPFPANRDLAFALEDIVRAQSALPCTIGIVDGSVQTRCTPAEIERFCTDGDILKVSLRNLPVVLARGRTGATTVAATIRLAYDAGIRVMATGGIGGVHQDTNGAPSQDQSADLTELGRCPVTVVCAGPKAILHLEATRERLETLGVTVVGWQTDTMPAFYCGESVFPVDVRCNTIEDVADIVRARDAGHLPAAILLTVPLAAEASLSYARVSAIVAEALSSEEARGLAPPQVTPFLLTAVRQELGEKALTANVDLLKQNAAIAAQLAWALVKAGL
jgi:pseudouridine-5'-phosphate glycosidase